MKNNSNYEKIRWRQPTSEVKAPVEDDIYNETINTPNGMRHKSWMLQEQRRYAASIGDTSLHLQMPPRRRRPFSPQKLFAESSSTHNIITDFSPPFSFFFSNFLSIYSRFSFRNAPLLIQLIFCLDSFTVQSFRKSCYSVTSLPATVHLMKI